MGRLFNESRSTVGLDRVRILRRSIDTPMLAFNEGNPFFLGKRLGRHV
jgi:hypothetical protein